MNLIFQGLELANFGSYAGTGHKLHLNFPGTLVYLTGKNLVDPALGANDAGKTSLLNGLYWTLTGKTLRSARPGGAVECWFTSDTVRGVLRFTKNDVDHVLIRERRPNNLMLDGETASNEHILSVLGLSEEAIKHTIIIGQFNDLFLDLRPEQQSQLFVELLNLQIWEDAISRAVKQARDIEQEISQTENKLAGLQGQIQELSSQFAETQQKKEEHNTNQVQISIKYKAARINLDKDIKKLRQELDIIIQKDKELPDISAQEKVIKGLAASLKEVETSLATININLVRDGKELQHAKSQLQIYKETENLCPACGQEVDRDHIDSKIEGYNIKCNKLITNLDNNQVLKTARERRAKDIINELDLLMEQTKAARKQITASLEKRAEVTIALNKLWDEDKYLKLKLDEIKTTKNPYDNILWNLRERKKTLHQQQKVLQEDILLLGKTLSTYNLWAKSFKEIRLNLIDDTLMELEFTVNKHIISLGLTDWEIGFDTERETAKGTLVNKMTINIFPPGRNDPVSLDSLGGGVTTRLQLGIFFGLSEILLARAGILPNLEILDEPTRHMSAEGVDDLLEALKERAHATNRCILFVDHQSIDSGLFDRTISVEKTAAGSRIVSQ